MPGDKFNRGIPKCSLAWLCTACAAGENTVRVTWREKHSCDSVMAMKASSKSWIFFTGFTGNVEITNKLESQKSCGLAEEIPKQLFRSFSCIFPHTLATGKGLSASNHPPQKKKKKKSPAQKRQGCLPLPGAMISVLMKTSEGLILSHTHRHSFHSGLIARESDALSCTGDAEFVWMIVTALISFISKISRSN